MPIPCYLAMTAAEFSNISPLPARIAWMACHFSPYGTGLSNLPGQLPEGSVLILNDRIPICGHDPKLVAQTLSRTVSRNNCAGVVLDLQHGDTETRQMVDALRQMECPVVIPEHLAAQDDTVLLPPVPPGESLEKYIQLRHGRKLWIELSAWGRMILVTEKGTVFENATEDPENAGFADDKLCCHYRMELGEAARFYLWRTWEDQQKLLEAARTMGVEAAIGLYQELMI